MKLSETKDVALELNDYFQKNSKSQISVAEPEDIDGVDEIENPKILRKKMERYCTQTMYIVRALDCWQNSDKLVEKYHIQGR